MKLRDMIHLEWRRVVGKAIVDQVEINPSTTLCPYSGMNIPSWDITYWLTPVKGDIPEGFTISSLQPPHVINLKSEGDRCYIVGPLYLVVGQRKFALGYESLI